MNISFKFYALILVKTLLRYLGRYMCVWCVLFPVTLAQAMRRIYIQGILLIFFNLFASLTAEENVKVGTQKLGLNLFCFDNSSICDNVHICPSVGWSL